MVKSQDCDYLSRDPIEIDFTSVTEENILESISALLNLISYGDNWGNLLFIFLMQFYQSPSFKEQKLFRKKTKTMLNYL